MATKATDRKKGRIYQRGKQGRYYLEYFLNGKRIQVTLKDAEGKAVTSREKAEVARDRELAPVLARDAAQRRQQAYNALQNAQEAAMAVMAMTRRKLPLAETWTRFLADTTRPDSGDATLKQYQFQWEAFVDWLGGKPDKPTLLADVTEEHANGYVQFLRGKNLSPGTINKHVRLCKLVFKILGPDEGVQSNPFARIKSRRETQNHRCELSFDKLCEICDAAQGEMKALFFLGLYTGQRLGDCCLLSWEQVDLMRGTILITPRKTASRSGKPISIPIHPALKPILEATPEGNRSGHVLPELASLYEKSRDNVTDRVQKVLKDCGVGIYQKGTGPGTGKRAVIQFGFHSLRHSTVSLLQAAGVPMAVVQEIVGHRTVAVTQRYTHVGEMAMQSAIVTLPAVTGKNLNADRSQVVRKRVIELAERADQATLEKVLALLDGTK